VVVNKVTTWEPDQTKPMKMVKEAVEQPSQRRLEALSNQE